MEESNTTKRVKGWLNALTFERLYRLGWLALAAWLVYVLAQLANWLRLYILTQRLGA